MSDETLVGTADAGAIPAAPKSDIEAEAQAKPETPEPKKPEEDPELQRKRNRTKEYIAKINSENAEYRRRLAELEARVSEVAPKAKSDPDAEPRLEDFDFDFEKFQRETAKWAIAQERKAVEAQTSKQAEQQKTIEVFTAYEQRAAAFAETHDDFLEVVNSIRVKIPMETQAAIAAHENGPAIAYHLGNNPKDAIQFAITPPEVADVLIEDLSSRLQEAPKAPALAPSLAPAPKPVTKAPPPPPSVGGRAVTEVPDEKLTDDEWLRREQQRDRERRRR